MSQVTEKRLEQASPESQGIDSGSILAFIEAVESKIHELHSFMLLRHGRLVAEGWWSPYQKDYPHSLFSMSKSFTSSAVGLAISEGYFSLDDFVVSFFPDDLPATVSENLAKMKIRHLLAMSTGHDVDTTGYFFERADGNWAKAFLAVPVLHEPSSHFLYNTGASYMLSAVVQKLTGQTLLQYLEPRLFRPLGIENPTWGVCPRGINFGGFGLSIKTEDIAVFGQLYLQKGLWGDKRILPEAWVEDATAFHTNNGTNPESDWNQGYGFQFWRCRHGAYRGDGAFGQFCVVMPEQNAVLAITGGMADMQPVLNIVWETLLPAMKQTALPNDEQAHAKLQQKLSQLNISAVGGKVESAIAAKVSGKRYQFSSNELGIESLVADFNEAGCTFKLKTPQLEEEIVCAYAAWQAGESRLFSDEPPYSAMPIVASGAWQSDTVFKMQLRLIETPFVQTLTFTFTVEQLTLETRVNVGFAPPKTLKFVAKMI